jgi:hypothetical protein
MALRLAIADQWRRVTDLERSRIRNPQSQTHNPKALPRGLKPLAPA